MIVQADALKLACERKHVNMPFWISLRCVY